MALGNSGKRRLWAFLLFFLLALGVFVISVLRFPIFGIQWIENYEQIPPTHFYYGNNTEETQIATQGVAVVNEAWVEIYCHLYANSTNKITLVPTRAYWNLTSISVAPGQIINVTVTNGNLNLDSDVAAGLQLYIVRPSADDVVQGVLILRVITPGWQKVSWEWFAGLGALIPLTFLKKLKKKHR
ncbi:MAG: hypothetical protein ACFFE8_03690 [Candidatus Heimdallarchaeota archaeon]